MAGTTKLISAGYDRLYWGMLNSDGYVIGQAATLSAGTPGSGMGKLDGVKTSAVAIPEPETVSVTGDDMSLGQFIFAATDTPSFVVEVGQNDLDYIALMQGTLVENLGDINITPLQPNNPDYPDICLVLQRRAKSKDTATSGVSRWEGIIIPKATIVPLGSDNFAERAATTYKYKVSTNVSTFLPWAKPITDSAHGTTGAPIFTFSSAYRVHIHTFKAGSSQTVYGPLTYTPVSSSITTSNFVFVDGILQTTDVTVNTSTKMVTFSVAPASNALIHVLYQHYA